MTEINDRLKETSENCLKAHERWASDDKSAETREALQDSIHELRKVASRLEIELAISERDQMTQRPIPIPSHRDSKSRAHADMEDNNPGNGSAPQRKPQQRRRTPRKPAGNAGNN